MQRRTIERRGFTLVELTVVAAIIAVIAAVVVPVLAQARRRGYLATCVSNLRQIGVARAMYADDNDGASPNSLYMFWPQYVSSPQIFTCPLDAWTDRGGWAWTNWGFMNTPAQKWPVPVSYIYLGALKQGFLPGKLAAARDPGFAACVLHGDPGIAIARMPPYFHGLTLRLRIDGSVSRVHTRGFNLGEILLQ